MMTVATISKFRQLLHGETLPYSALSESLRHELISEQLLVVQTHGSRRCLYACQPDALRSYLSQHYEELRSLQSDDSQSVVRCRTRAEQAAAGGNSKLTNVRSCPGFMVNAYEPIDCVLNGQCMSVCPAEGTMLFVADWQSFSVPSDVVIVGVENMENFRLIRQQKYLFDPLGAKVLFVSRYPQSTDLRAWLMQIPNRYVHFGDFDLAGMHIYETELARYLGDRASFLVPDDIEQRLQGGSTMRYNDQLSRFRHYTPTDPRLFPLFHLLHLLHRAYDQEGYILV